MFLRLRATDESIHLKNWLWSVNRFVISVLKFWMAPCLLCPLLDSIWNFMSWMRRAINFSCSKFLYSSFVSMAFICKPAHYTTPSLFTFSSISFSFWITSLNLLSLSFTSLHFRSAFSCASRSFFNFSNSDCMDDTLPFTCPSSALMFWHFVIKDGATFASC